MQQSTYIHDEIVHNSNAAREVLPILFEVFKPKSIIDVGCGLGNWIQVAKELGVEKIIGVDGDYVDRSMLKIDDSEFVEKDLKTEFNLHQKFDLAICLEVAEHLPAEASEILIRSIINHADVIMFSAAVPGQGGQNHINEQWPGYWRAIFSKYHYEMLDFFRFSIWNNENVERWYKQNLFLVVKKGHFLDSGYNRDALSIIHPELFEAVKKQYEERAKRYEQSIVRLSKRDWVGRIVKFFTSKK